MSRIAYVNGRYVPHRDASVHIEDRGYQFADGVYEVCEVRAGRLIDERRHMERLGRSLRELRIDHADEPDGAVGRPARDRCAQSCHQRHRLPAGHARRGAARSRVSGARYVRRASSSRRARSIRRAANARRRSGVAVITVPESRWARVDIKSVSLLPNVLAKQAAREKGAREAWFVDRDGFVTEGASVERLDRHGRRQGDDAAGR